MLKEKIDIKLIEKVTGLTKDEIARLYDYIKTTNEINNKDIIKNVIGKEQKI